MSNRNAKLMLSSGSHYKSNRDAEREEDGFSEQRQDGSYFEPAASKDFEKATEENKSNNPQGKKVTGNSKYTNEKNNHKNNESSEDEFEQTDKVKKTTAKETGDPKAQNTPSNPRPSDYFAGGMSGVHSTRN